MSYFTSVFVESNAVSLGSDIDAADEDDSYAEAENDSDCNSDTDGDLNAQDFLVPDFRKINAPDPCTEIGKVFLD